MNPVGWMLLGVVLHMHFLNAMRRQVLRRKRRRAKGWNRWITWS